MVAAGRKSNTDALNLAAAGVPVGTRGLIDANEAGGTALMFAALSSRTEVVRLLLANGAQASARDRRGLDAATLAEQQGNRELADILRSSTKTR
jgi:ankyrin repeat protein